MFLDDIDDIGVENNTDNSNNTSAPTVNTSSESNSNNSSNSNSGFVNQGTTTYVFEDGDDVDLTGDDGPATKNIYVTSSDKKIEENEKRREQGLEEEWLDDEAKESLDTETYQNEISSDVNNTINNTNYDSNKEGNVDGLKTFDSKSELYASPDQLNEKWLNGEGISNIDEYKDVFENTYQKEYGGKVYFLYDAGLKAAAGVGYGFFDVFAIMAMMKSDKDRFPMRITCTIEDFGIRPDSSLKIEDVSSISNMEPVSEELKAIWNKENNALGTHNVNEEFKEKARRQMVFKRMAKIKELKNMNDLTVMPDPTQFFSKYKEVSFFQLYELFMTYECYNATFHVDVIERRPLFIPDKVLYSYDVRNVKLISYNLSDVTADKDNTETLIIEGEIDYSSNDLGFGLTSFMVG